MTEGPGHNQGIAGDALKGFVEQIESLNGEKAEVQDRIKGVYAELKGGGFDTATVRRIIKLRAMKPVHRSEASQLLELYASVLGLDDLML